LTWLPRIMPRLVLFFLQCFGVLTLMCLDRPKWSDSMTSHNFGDHRIAPKRAILWFFLKPVNFGAKKIQKSLRTGNRPKKGDSMKMLLVAHNPFEEFRCSYSRIAPIGAIVWTPKFHNTNYTVIELPQKGRFYALAQKG
jgi:hypothetical protein